MNEERANSSNPNYEKTYRARICFEKYGVMQYVGHLDTMRFFQKAIKRAGIPVAYTKGFHPHQIISFALPLGIGTTSEGDFMDIEVTERIAPKAAAALLNEQMAGGASVKRFTYIPEKEKKAMAAVEAARYLVYFKEDCYIDNAYDYFKGTIKAFYEDASSIRITKKTKKSERVIDLKPLIYEFDIHRMNKDSGTEISEGTDPDIERISGRPMDETIKKLPYFTVTLSAGSNDNIKPELVFSHFFEQAYFDDDAPRIGVHRLSLLKKNKDNVLVPLDEFEDGGAKDFP